MQHDAVHKPGVQQQPCVYAQWHNGCDSVGALDEIHAMQADAMASTNRGNAATARAKPRVHKPGGKQNEQMASKKHLLQSGKVQ